jgi:two-component system nitrogen regulation sensor histidine kinase GlnL
MTASFSSQSFPGLDLLSTAVLIVDRDLSLLYANPAAENLFAFSLKSVAHQKLERIFPGKPALFAILEQSIQSRLGYHENELVLEMPHNATLKLACVVTPVEHDHFDLVLEFRQLDQQLRIAREEKILEHQQLNRELIRNLAHEIKNPLGGIRGSAQLLERELPQNELREYTQVIVKEADRLQALMDRLLTPSRLPQIGPVNIHEVLERARSLIIAEFPRTLRIRRDYDTSLPEIIGDKEQLIQAILNVTRNAAQALEGNGEIRLVTRIARNITLAKHRYRHAIQVEIADNGPGIPENLKEKIFYPLVSGRNSGSGLGLSLAQNFINQHQGIIEFDSVPGNTRFTIVLPVRNNELANPNLHARKS